MIEEYLLLNGFLLYAVLFFALMGGAIGLPIPEDIPLIAAGIAAQTDRGNVFLLFLTCYSAVLLGDLVVFYIGRKLGPRLFQQEWFKRKLSASKVRRFRLKMEKRSLPMIFIARHLFYLRTVTFLTCGAVKMKVSRFVLVDAIAALISVPLMMTIGYFAAEHYEKIIDNIERVLLIGGIITAIGYGIYRFSTKKKASA